MYPNTEDDCKYNIKIFLIFLSFTLRTLKHYIELFLLSFVAPSTPHNLRVTETNFTLIELSWEIPNPSNGIITNYTVCKQL